MVSRGKDHSLLSTDVETDASSVVSVEDEFQHPVRDRRFTQGLVDNVRMIRAGFEPKPYKENFLRRHSVIAFILMYAIAGVAIPWVILRNHFTEAIEKGEMTGLSGLFVDDTHKQRVAKAYLCMIPLTCLSVPVFVPSLATASFLPYLALTTFGIKQASEVAVKEEFRMLLSGFFAHFIQTVIALTFLRALDYLDHVMHEIIVAEDELVQDRNVAKWHGLMTSVGVTRTGNEAKDKIMAIEGTRSIAHMVYEKVWYTWMMGGKIFALMAYVVCSLSGDHAGSVVAAGFAWYAFAGLFMSYKFWDKTAILIKLWMHKPFFVGDIVTIGDFSGFVEHISMSYVIIRTFDCKQTYLPLADLVGAVMQNWSRRPVKPVVLEFSASPSSKPESVEALLKFSKGWIEQSSEILQTGYKKYCLNSLGHGFDFKIIFSPAIGVDKNKLRNAFILAVTSKAQELAVQLTTENATSLYLPDMAGSKKLQ